MKLGNITIYLRRYKYIIMVAEEGNYILTGMLDNINSVLLFSLRIFLFFLLENHSFQPLKNIHNLVTVFVQWNESKIIYISCNHGEGFSHFSLFYILYSIGHGNHLTFSRESVIIECTWVEIWNRDSSIIECTWAQQWNKWALNCEYEVWMRGQP